MPRAAGHTHIWRVIGHSRAVDKTARVLLGCLCSAIKNEKPRQNRKEDAEFWPYILSLPHACCDMDLGKIAMTQEEWDLNFKQEQDIDGRWYRPDRPGQKYDKFGNRLNDD